MLDVTGEIYGNLKAVRSTGKKYNGSYIWEFECLLCREHIEARLTQVRSGSIIRCKKCGRAAVLNNLSTMSPEEKFGLVHGTNVSKIVSGNLQRNNTSGHAGVSLHRQEGRQDVYISYIYFAGKRYNLGSYKDINDAIKARETAEDKMHSDFLSWYAKEYPDRWKKIHKRKI